MSGCIEMLDQALEICEREIGYLADEDVESAENAAIERSRLLQEASKDFAAQDAATLRERLERLQDLQQQATAKATALHEDLRSRLGRTKKEVRRLGGYKDAAKPAPRVVNRYLNKTG